MRKLALLVTVLGTVVSALAQTTDASLSGTISDPSGASVPGARVTLTSLATGIVASAESNEAGLYRFASVAPGDYSVTAEREGFQKAVFERFTLDTAARATLNLSLTLGNTTETVEVSAESEQPLQTETSTVGGVVTGRKVLELPLVGRNVYEFIGTQAGVGGTNNQNFNGARAGSLNVTLDGVDIRDNYFNGLGSTQTANTINVDRIEEFRIVTSPADAEYGHGSGQVILVSRSGTNQFHGSLFEELRNTVLTANTWFNNQRGQQRNFLIRNQFGGRFGGPIKKNQTFFHFHYDGQRQRAHDAVTSVVYTQSARNGIYRFYPGIRNGNTNAAIPTVDTAGNPVRPGVATGDLQAVNVFGRDPNRLVPDPSGNIARTLALYPLPNDYRFGDGLNTAGYTFIRNTAIDFDTWDFRIDHQLNSDHRMSFTFSNQGYDSSNVTGAQLLPTIPAGQGPNNTKVAGLSFVSVLKPNLINEFRAGVNRPRQLIISPWQVDPTFLGKATNGERFLTVFTNITSPFAGGNFGSEAQGRISPVYQFSDTMTWLKGRHSFRGGFERKYVSYSGYDAYAVMPRATLGQGNVAVQNIITIPGIGNNGAAAQQMLSELAGTLGSSYQTMNSAGGANPTYVPGQTRYRTWRAPEFSAFFKDDFKIRQGLTLNLGVRYELYATPEETNGLGLGLVGGGNSVFGLSGRGFADMFQPGRANGSLMQFETLGPKTKNPDKLLFPTPRKNFAPAVGLSWSLPWWGKDKTVIRAGYSMGYERNAVFVVNQIIFGPGYQSTPIYNQASLYTLQNMQLPHTATSQPLQTVPLTDRTQPAYGIDPNLRTPYYQNYNLSIQRSLGAGFSLEVRYVGNKGTRLIRAPNVNESNIFENGILDAFRTTQAGGNAPLFDRIFNGIQGVGTAQSGSDFVRAFTTTQTFLAQNNVGGMANFLNTSALAGLPGDLLRRAGLPENFVVSNPQVASAFFITNLSSSTYHALQVELTKRFTKGYTLQANYSLAKGMGDDEGNETGFRGTLRTLRRFRLDKREMTFSRRHVVRANGIYELPFGERHHFLSSVKDKSFLGRIVNGWQVGGFLTLQSGEPMTVTAANAFNFLQAQGAGASVGAATAATTVAIPKDMGVIEKVGNGIQYFGNLRQVTDPWVANIATPAIRNLSTLFAMADSSGRIMLQNPQPGQLGSLSQSFFRGPSLLRLDFNLLKRIKVSERYELQIRADAVNMTNTPAFDTPDLSINSVTFGRITSTLAGSNRVVVVGMRLNF